MTSGIYALASLDGAPLQREDIALLGLDAEEHLRRANGLVVRVEDELPGGPAISFFVTAESVTAFAGYLDEPEELRARLGLATNCAAELAWAAVERFGPGAPAAVTGEWSLLHWNIRAKELTLLASQTVRDPVCWATNGHWLAVAPKPLTLCGLSWVGQQLDPEGFALYLSRAGLRKILAQQTVWKGVSRLAPGLRECFSLGHREQTQQAAEPPPVLWTGSFEAAVEASSTLLRRIMEQQLQRYGRTAFYLSGGLDSSLLTVHAAPEQGPGAEMFCLSSVAPEGSGLPDEREFSTAVATQSGVTQYLVCPVAETSPYRPEIALWEQQEIPVVSPRHYLKQALLDEARLRGARAVMDGTAGEHSLTQTLVAEAWLSWPRRMQAAVHEWQRLRRNASGWPQAAFHAQLAAGLLDSLPRPWKDAWKAGPVLPPKLHRAGAVGVHPATQKSTAQETSTSSGLRRILPFRDRRILRLAAGFPAAFSDYEGTPRALARAMLRGKVPDSVRLRPRGRPFSPDYHRRMQTHAEAALERLPVFYANGVDKYLDLKWLSGALTQIRQGASPLGLQNGAQSTACAAEFLMWVAERR